MSHASRQRLLMLFSRCVENPWFAYSGILLLQLKMMWRIWDYRDLTPGDASSYFAKLLTWLDEGILDLAWSPLYTLFLAFLQLFTENLFWVSMLAQVGIAVSVSLLLLALFRRLLPSHIAWLLAAWWTLQPINFDTVYNAHLFSTIFLLALLLLAAILKNPSGRGLALAGMLFTALSVRSEFIAIFYFWAVVTIAYEWHLLRRGAASEATIKSYALGYGLPFLLVILVTGGVYIREAAHSPELMESFATKKTLYVCQNYAYSRVQQGDPWRGDPWSECEQLLERDFGRSNITFPEALLINPKPVLEHFWWNLKLFPSGTQLALFSSYSGGVNPDFMRAKKSELVWIPFLLVVGLCGLALWKEFLQPLFDKSRSVENGYVWLLLGSAALAIMAIMLVVRPRPSYMFPYSIFLMALSGLGLKQLLVWLRSEKLLAPLVAVGGGALILAMPGYYTKDYISHFGGTGQGWRNLYEQLAPHIDRQSATPPVIYLPSGGNYLPLCHYLGASCHIMEPGTENILERIAAESIREEFSPGYLLYLEDMLRHYPPGSQTQKGALPGYVELQCAAPVDNLMNCVDGSIDLQRGVINDGASDIPLQAALLVKDGNLVKQQVYPSENGYYLQIHMSNNRIGMVQVVDRQLFQTSFNRRYMLGQYDRQLLLEEYKNFPLARLFRVIGH